MISELFEIYKRNFPYIIRNEKTVLSILQNKDNKIIEKRNEKNKLTGVSIINKNAIILLCVDKEYRNKGIGTELLANSEAVIKKNGYDEAVVGEGFDYLMPGVPTGKRYFDSKNEDLYYGVNDEASIFFTKRGYVHSWDCNCFDMRLCLNEFDGGKQSIGGMIEGIRYRWAVITDLEEICQCTNDAHEDFTKWYRNENLYDESSSRKVLIALNGSEVAGTLIVSTEEEENMGSVGCTAVKHAYRGKHIALNLIMLGTKYLKDAGLKEAFLGYTYSGLDYLYGCAGYKICLYYMMAKKDFSHKE